MSSTSRINLSARVGTIWYQSKTKVKRLLGNVPTEMRATRGLTSRFPHEIAEMIIAHLTHDLSTLKACSLASRSWYIAAVPHIHHTITLRRDEVFTGGKMNPPSARARLKPLSNFHELGLMSLVREVRVDQWRGMDRWFAPQTFGRRNWDCFSALANVHTLKIQNMEIYRFIPDVEHHFGNLSPTLRSITLYDPSCHPSQLSYFLSFFPNLDDIEIRLGSIRTPDPTIPGEELTPFPAPKFRGRLALYDFSWVETWTHFIASSGGLQFQRLDLCGSASCEPVLLEACAGTLEALRLSTAADPFKGYSRPSPEYDLSRLEVLRSLQLRDCTANFGSHRQAIAMGIFSTVTSPVFSELVLDVRVKEFAGLPSEVALFETLRKMNEIRPFRLVFSLEASYGLSQGEVQREFTGTLHPITENGLLDFLGSPPAIRWARSHRYGWDTSFPQLY